MISDAKIKGVHFDEKRWNADEKKGRTYRFGVLSWERLIEMGRLMRVLGKLDLEDRIKMVAAGTGGTIPGIVPNMQVPTRPVSVSYLCVGTIPGTVP